MDKNAVGYLFAGISALAGIIYIWQARNAEAQNPVTNVFPPLNTGENSLSSQDEPVQAVASNNSGTTQSSGPKLVAYPVYIV